MRLGLVAFSMLLAGSVFAQGLPGSGGFNAIIFGNATTNGGHSDGSLAIGGNWNATGHEAPQRGDVAKGQWSTYSNIGALVNGNVLTNGNAKMQNGADLLLSGTLTNTMIYNGGGIKIQIGGTQATQLTEWFQTQKLLADSRSAAMKNFAGATNIVVSDPNNINVNLASVPGNLKVFNISAAAIGQLGTINFSGGDGNETVIVNVLGTTVNWRRSVNYSGGGGFSRLIWNFPDATALNVTDRDIIGTVLAPKSRTVMERNIEGQLFANEWELRNSVELHYGGEFVFDGDISTVPEPATMAALGVGVAALLRRRRKSS